MEIHPSIISQAIYGEHGRMSIPLSVFAKQSNNRQIGGNKDIEHLGVPMVLALVNINMDKPCNHSIEHSYNNQAELMDEYIPSEFEPNETEELASISDEIYDSMFHSVLEEPITEVDDITESTYLPSKKYTRKNRK